MGNKPSTRADAGTIHASLARNRSGRSTKSSRSVRRISLMHSTRVREPIACEPKETLPPNIEHAFELDLPDLTMQRNLCGCSHPLARVDVVVDADDTRRAFVDRRIGLHANTNDVDLLRHELMIHCYLTRQRMLATDDQQPHPHLVRLRGHFEFQQTLHVLTEYYPSGSLLSTMLPASDDSTAKDTILLRAERVVVAARQLCAAVAFMHEEGVAHMDISLENIFVDSAGELCLGDFRHSVYIGKNQRRRQVAPTPVRRAYGAPELYTGREVDLFKADAWSVGIVLVMLLTKQTPLGEATTQDTHYRLLQVLGVPAFLERMIQDKGLSLGNLQAPVIQVQDVVKLLTDLLVCEPDKRVSIADAISQFPWLAAAASTLVEPVVFSTESDVLATGPTSSSTTASTSTF